MSGRVRTANRFDYHRREPLIMNLILSPRHAHAKRHAIRRTDGRQNVVKSLFYTRLMLAMRATIVTTSLATISRIGFLSNVTEVLNENPVSYSAFHFFTFCFCPFLVYLHSIKRLWMIGKLGIRVHEGNNKSWPTQLQIQTLRFTVVYRMSARFFFPLFFRNPECQSHTSSSSQRAFVCSRP